MHGQPETIIPANEGAVVAVQRGTAGLALINLSSSAQTLDIDLSATLPTFPDGTYTDPVSGATFTVASGHLTGTLAPYTSALLTR